VQVPPVASANVTDDAADNLSVAGADADELVIEAEFPAPPRWAPLTLGAFVVLVICSYIGTAVSTKWVNTNPEGLLMLSSRVRHLVAVAGGGIPFTTYFVIGFVRLTLAYTVCHLIGRAYGRTVLVWFGRFLGVKAVQIHSMMGLFHKAEWFVVPFFAGSNIVAAITGIARVSARRLALLLTIGLVVRLVFWWLVARIADDEIDVVLDFLNRYQTPALIISTVITVVVVGVNLHRGRNFEL
jgi:hypothetical protein